MKTLFFGEGSSAGKGGRKKKKTARSKMDGLSFSGNDCTFEKKGKKTRLGTCRKSIKVIAKSQQ